MNQQIWDENQHVFQTHVVEDRLKNGRELCTTNYLSTKKAQKDDENRQE